MAYTSRPNPYQGTPGPQGPPGADGADGSVWHWVTGTPAGSLGKVGDWATRTDTGATWQKTGASTWTSRGSLRGPQGIQGPQGPQGATGATGAAGTRWYEGPDMPLGSLGQVGDFYLFSDGVVFEKTGPSTWESANLNLRGPKGDKGDTGATGATGPAGTITGASATGLAAGASPTVTLGGTPSARTFAFGIPQGAKGDKGDKGDTGATGPKGDTGDTGPAGTAATVSVGTTTTGAPGTNAAVTQSGTSANRTFNFTIPRGDKGDKGDTGGAGVLGGAKFVHPHVQSIPNAQWTAIGSAGSSMTSIVPGTVSGSTGSAGFRMVVNSAGWWMVGASIGYDGASNTGRRILAVETWTGTDPGVGNGSTIVRAESPAGQSSLVSINGTTVAYLAANTNVRLLAYQNSTSSLSTRTEVPTELWLTRVL